MADDTYSRGPRNPPGRGGTGADGPAVDPLTELARLIGQSDPFAAVEQRRPNPRPAEPSRQPTDWPAGSARHDDHPGHDHGRDQGYDDRAQDYTQDRAQYADRRDAPSEYDRQAPADEGYYDDPHDAYAEPPYDDRQGATARHDDMSGYDADPQHQDDVSGFYDDEASPPRRRGWMLTAMALIGLSIVGAAAAFAYHKVFRDGPPSIIARDSGPNKIIPSSQNADSRSNKRLDRIATGSLDERMVSREEQPIPVPDSTRGAPGIGFTPLTAPVQPGPPADVGAAAPGAPDGTGPRKIQTVRVPAEGAPQIPPAPRPSAPRATAAQAPAQPTPLPLAPQGAPPAPPPATQGGPLSLTPQAQVATAAPPPPPPRAAPRAPAPAAAEAASGYYVQLTAQRSEEDAQSSFQGIQAKYANLLGSRQPVIRRKDLGDKGIFFAAQVGPLSRDDAASLCQSLKSAAAPCMLQKN